MAPRRKVLGGVAALLFMGLSGCGRPAAPTGLTIPRGQQAPGWPSVLTSTGGRGPALFAGPDSQAPAFGHLGTGVRVRVEGPPQDQRIPVTVGGALIVRGWADLTQLAVPSARRGRIDGTPLYVGVHDPISILARDPDGSVQALIRPRFGRPELDSVVNGYSAQLGADWIGEGGFDEADPELTPGQAMQVLPGQEVVLYDRPSGNIIARIPAAQPPLGVMSLRERGEWAGVRVGVGPFLVGYMQIAVLAPASPDVIGARPTRSATEGMPSRIESESGTLFRVAPGTRVEFYGEDVGTVRAQGWARELSPRQGDQADIYVAVDDGVAIRGLVPVSSLTPVTTP